MLEWKYSISLSFFFFDTITVLKAKQAEFMLIYSTQTACFYHIFAMYFDPRGETTKHFKPELLTHIHSACCRSARSYRMMAQVRAAYHAGHHRFAAGCAIVCGWVAAVWEAFRILFAQKNIHTHSTRFECEHVAASAAAGDNGYGAHMRTPHAFVVCPRSSRNNVLPVPRAVSNISCVEPNKQFGWCPSYLLLRKRALAHNMYRLKAVVLSSHCACHPMARCVINEPHTRTH